MARLGRALCILGLSATLLLVPRLAGAADEYPAPAFFLGGLTEQSSWDEILKKPGVKTVFPFVGFGPTFVPLSGICSGGEMLAIADPRMDTGVRVSAEQLRAQVQAAAAARGYVAEPGGQLAAMTLPGASSQVAMRYPVERLQGHRAGPDARVRVPLRQALGDSGVPGQIASAAVGATNAAGESVTLSQSRQRDGGLSRA